MAKPFQPTPHPVLGLPDAAQCLALGEARWRELMLRREQIIRDERADPFRHGWEPPIWRVCDALLGFPWVAADWADRMRHHLGFARPVQILLINGGQRAGKSQYAASRVMRVLRGLLGPDRAAARAWCLHSTLQMSVDYQQPILYDYLPRELKSKDFKERITYVSWKQKTGFSEQKFVLPSGSDCLFKAYEQDRKTIEGGNLDIVWCDELVPSDWVETLELRIAEKTGRMIITFTPVEGYSETVRLFQDGAVTTRESLAFLLPRDGGAPDAPRALGLARAEDLTELWAADRESRAALAAQSGPERCEEWCDSRTGQPDAPPDREWERVPRVMRCADPEGKRAVVFFHSNDNPYGNPKNVWSTIASKPTPFIRERFYGVASKTLSARFTRFDRAAHVIAPASIPTRGTLYHLADPCHGRNIAQQWYRVTPEHVYLYREWPSGYYIPGVGAPGPWALPDGRRPDGRMGPAQKSFGWGLLDYKREIARLEGWKDLEGEADVAAWDAARGAVETVAERLIDARFASTPKIERDRPVTLLTEFDDIGLCFRPVPGADEIEQSSVLVDDALAYDAEQPVSYLNQPRLLISSECVNTIYALTTWTGFTREGRRCLDGATKDWIDLLRYFFLSDLGYTGDANAPSGEEDAEEESEFEPAPRRYY